MATLSLTCPFPLLRGQSNCPIFITSKFVQLKELSLQKNWDLRAVSKKNNAESGMLDASKDENITVEKSSRPRRAPRRGSKKTSSENSEENIVPEAAFKKTSSENSEENIVPEAASINAVKEESKILGVSSEDSKKVTRRRRKKVDQPLESSEGESTSKITRKRKTKKKTDNLEDENSNAHLRDLENPNSILEMEVENKNLHAIQHKDDDDDASMTYDWPPLVCCFGAAQRAFIPSGRPSNRMIDHEIHRTLKDMLWAPAKFVRAPGGSSSSVAIALASLGGRVAFMGKLGDDEYGEELLYNLNVNKVQTRSVKIDSSRPTAKSYMKFSRRGSLRMTSVKSCVEDCLLSSEINIDVLKEAKMFYFNSSALLDQNMRSTTIQAIELSKKLGGVVFFDLNLPLPLWQSSEETKRFIQKAWNYSDIIEVTKQEIEFLLDIKTSEQFDTPDNGKSKFIHHKPEVLLPLWHENLSVLFVTNGTSKIHYYTDKDNGSVLGMEDAPITPFTCDMSASGDAIVAALMRMLTVQPHLSTDKGYLEHMIEYAINCGATDQWLTARTLGFPPKEGSTAKSSGVKSITEKEYRTLEPAN